MTSEAPEVNPDVPQTARIWNYWLGGKDNFAVDRQVGDEILKVLPDMALFARATRAFLRRSVHHLAADLGVRQFLDVGTGLPTADNTHQVAQRADPSARVVYVDNDPHVLAHARALLTGTEEGETAYLAADLRDPDNIIAAAADTLDFAQPIALLLMGVVGHITDDGEARALVRRLVSALPSGSYLALYDATNVIDPASAEAIEIWNRDANPPYVLRSPAKLESFFDGLELLPPGLVSCPRWHPEPGADTTEIDEFCGVGRKP
ncbi:SAM-dependent methyltransferase [Actinocorallia sp. A-T 12471]|uniref:SAM-dependent methyltransferase n=1 Tax=Actinocorallia sp. A-T 12471 TaxID=3089813 RepID=UPI0029CB1094|nr:SAM-dependent methyltransferase [Actinocorallia sp. A-T 12471]MDX6740385.1 SAM-dependent methyltransferase [Actinocorallia sp. A-T 12471]